MIDFPNIDPIAIEIGPLAIRWYGIMYLVGFVVGWWLLDRRARQEQWPWNRDQVADVIFWGMLGVILGGRIGYMLFYGWDNIVADPLSVFRIWEGGMSFHGGVLGVLAAMWWYARRNGRRFFEVLDYIVPVVPVGLATGRIGNFINGELWGGVTDVPWAVVVNGVPRHPSQLYEFLLEGVVLFAVLWWFSARRPPIMAVSALFGVLYGVFRFLVEFIRLPDAHLGYLAFGWLTMGQVLSLPMILVGAWLLVMAYRKRATVGESES